MNCAHYDSHLNTYEFQGSSRICASMRSPGLYLCRWRESLKVIELKHQIFVSFPSCKTRPCLGAPGRDSSTALQPWVHEWQAIGINITREQSFNAKVLKNHLVDFIIVCHLDTLLITVQQVLLTTRIGNKGTLHSRPSFMTMHSQAG
jgi:hypothetical protein